MLGVRREGVNKAASSLSGKELISYSRGELKIIDEQGLEKNAVLLLLNKERIRIVC